VRQEAGKEQMVEVHYDEGVANHIGPEPCVSTREGVGEASVGVRAGQPLNREIGLVLIGLIVSVEKLKSPIRIMLARDFWDGALGNAFQAAHPLQYRLIPCLDPKAVTIEYLPE
jgi:hypothetical protein